MKLTLPALVILLAINTISAVSHAEPPAQFGFNTFYSPTERSFSDADVQGTYSLFLTGTSEIGEGDAIGLVNYDGVGGLTGNFFGNAPGTAEQRALFSSGLLGSYQVNRDGTIIQEWTMTDTPFPSFPMDLVITDANIKGQANEIRAVFRSPSPIIGGLVTYVLKRRTNRRAFTAANLRGTYTLELQGGTHQSIAIGLIRYDGEGAVSGSFIDSRPLSFTERDIINAIFEGDYRIDAEGFITQSWSQESEAGIRNVNMDLIVTGSSRNIVTEVVGFFQEPSDSIAENIVTVRIRKR